MSNTTIPIIPSEKSVRSISEFEIFQETNSDSTKLGKGSFATVQLAKEKKSGTLVAIKKINVNVTSASKSEIHNLQTEIKVHREVSHPNIIKFHDYIQEGNNIYLILDYAPNGNLYTYLHKKKTLSAEETFRFFYQSCLAIQYPHQKDVLHRDLKPENLLLDKEFNIKLCDFGWAARSIRDKRTTFCGTYEYMAPEIVEKRPYDYKVDIWSLGVLLYELTHGEAPYKGRSLQEITASLSKGAFQFRSAISPELKDLIHKILRISPNDRISLSEILSHNWVRKNLAQYGYNTNPTKTLDHLRSLGRTPTSRFPQETYSDSIDKENLQMKGMYSQKAFEVKDEVARALINLGHAPDYMADAKRKLERTETLPGALAFREVNQSRPLMEGSSTTTHKMEMKKQNDYSVHLIRTLPEREIQAAMDALDGYNRQSKFLDRSIGSSNVKFQFSENETNITSQNTAFDNKGDNSNMKTYQKTLDLLKKAQSSRSYYVKPNYLEKSLSQQPVFKDNYNSNPNIYNPTFTDIKTNYTQIRSRPNYIIKTTASQYDNEEESHWKKPNFSLRTEAVKLGSDKIYPYEAPAPSSRPGLSTMNMSPYLQTRQEVESRNNYSPYYSQNRPSGIWQQNILNPQSMGSPMSVGTPSLLLLNERHFSK